MNAQQFGRQGFHPGSLLHRLEVRGLGGDIGILHRTGGGEPLFLLADRQQPLERAVLLRLLLEGVQRFAVLLNQRIGAARAIGVDLRQFGVVRLLIARQRVRHRLLGLRAAGKHGGGQRPEGRQQKCKGSWHGMAPSPQTALRHP